MKWRYAHKDKPADKSYIFVWNILQMRQEMMICNWEDGNWDFNKIKETYAPFWAYVLEE